MLRFIGTSGCSSSGQSGTGSLLIVSVLLFVGLETRDDVREMLCCPLPDPGGEWLYCGVLGTISLLLLDGTGVSALFDDLWAGSDGCPHRFRGWWFRVFFQIPP